VICTSGGRCRRLRRSSSSSRPHRPLQSTNSDLCPSTHTQEDALAAGAWRHIFRAAERKAKHGSSYMDAQLLLSLRKGAEGLPPGLVCALNQLADVFVAPTVAAVVGKEQQAECPWALHLMG